MLGARREGVRQDLPSRHFFVRRRYGVAPPPAPLPMPSLQRAVPTLPRRPRRDPPRGEIVIQGSALKGAGKRRIAFHRGAIATSQQESATLAVLRASARGVLPASCRGIPPSRAASVGQTANAWESLVIIAAEIGQCAARLRRYDRASRLRPPTARVVNPLKAAALADPEPAPARSSRSPSVRGLRPRSTK